MERPDGSRWPRWLGALPGVAAPVLFAAILFSWEVPAARAAGAVVAGALVTMLVAARARDRAFTARHPEAAWYAASIVLAATGVALLEHVSADTAWGIWLAGLLAGGHGYGLERRKRRARGARNG